MAHFTACFQAPGAADPHEERARIVRAYREGLGESTFHEHRLDRAWLLTVERGSQAPRVDRHDEGWVALAGQPIDLDEASGGFSSTRFLAALVGEDSRAINRFEGLYAAVAWHAPSRTAWAVNDQTSNLNLYVIERPEGLWVSTVALPLARGLRLGLDPGGVREFFSRGTLLNPTTLFAGLRRLDMGERYEYSNGRGRIVTHWAPVQEPREGLNTRSAAAALSDLAVDRVRRYADGGRKVVSDLTGGYDSRLVVSAAHAAGCLTATTVDGAEGHGDVEVARLVARAMGWELQHFDTAKFWDRPIDAAMRRELTYRTNGELAFTEVYHHLLSRPLLGERFGLHLTGGGGELVRSFPWSQEFLGIGKRRRANVENALVYRYFQEGPPPGGLFVTDWHPLVVDAFRTRLTRMFDAMPGTLTTQQLDVAYLWRMSGFAPYTAAVQGWMPSVAPLMCAETVDLAIALPWKLRMTSGLVRRMIERQCPEAAAVATRYGGTAAPTRASNLHRQAWQVFKQGYHLFLKLDRVRLGGLLGRVLPGIASDPVVRRPYDTDEFRAFLDPSKLRCRALFHPEALRATVEGRDERWLLRIATIEQVCRELDFEPDPRFLEV
jgi:hypothetical protein